MYDCVLFDFFFMKLILCEFGNVVEEYYMVSVEVCLFNW